jgi:hypothetical protein
MTENWEHFWRAAQVLVGPGPVKQRLCDAYLKHVKQVDARELPRELQPDYAALLEALHCAQAAGGLGTVEATIRKMSEQEAGRLAASMLAMYVTLAGGDSREPSTSTPRQLRIVGDDSEIPAFLNRA